MKINGFTRLKNRINFAIKSASEGNQKIFASDFSQRSIQSLTLALFADILTIDALIMRSQEFAGLTDTEA